MCGFCVQGMVSSLPAFIRFRSGSSTSKTASATLDAVLEALADDEVGLKHAGRHIPHCSPSGSRLLQLQDMAWQHTHAQRTSLSAHILLPGRKAVACVQGKVAAAAIAALASVLHELPADTRKAKVLPALRGFLAPRAAVLGLEVQLALATRLTVLLEGLQGSLDGEEDALAVASCFK